MKEYHINIFDKHIVITKDINRKGTDYIIKEKI